MTLAKVKWRGKTFDKRTAEMLQELASISGSIYIHPTQGSYSGAAASAGTHTGGGAVDLMHPSWSKADYDTVAELSRKIGFFGSHRTPAQANWPRHCHLIAVQPKGKNDRGVLSSAAHRQVVAYYEGRNGLASGKRDDGPRQYVGTTWESYKRSQIGGQTVSWYKYSGKPSGVLALKPGTYVKLDATIPAPPRDGVEHRMVYANVTPTWRLPASDPGYAAQTAVLRVRWTRVYATKQDNTAYGSFVIVPGDESFLLTHVHWEMGEKNIGGHWGMKIDGDITGGTVTTRYCKGWMP
jgi:hypothetical protein